MPRKRKIQVMEEKSPNSTMHHGPMYTIMNNAQLNETFHKKYVREMKQLYEKMDHEAFFYILLKMLKSAMEAEETNEYAHTTLIFLAKYVSSYQTEDTHPILADVLNWILNTISQNPHIRYRLCQFVNMILNALGAQAALDDVICDNIMSYMIGRLRDINPHVRIQAILALQRLQCPDNPDDVVLRAYQFHLSADPSPKVRQSVITSMGRNYNTIPHILERLWDIDDKVRRHTYLHMSSYPVKAYKVVQRLTLLEQGMNDRSEMVRKVVSNVMIPQWLEAYNKNYIDFVSALKLDGTTEEVGRFIKIARSVLLEIFKRQEKYDIVQYLPLDEEFEFNKCVPFQNLTLEVGIYWLSMVEHLIAEGSDEIDSILPELSTFCSYIQKFCENKKPDMETFQNAAFQNILLCLIEIIATYDLGDEIGRENLQKLLAHLVKNHDITEKIIIIINKCAENLFPEQDLKLQFFVDIIKEILESGSYKKCELLNRELIEELLKDNGDNDLKLKVSTLKVKLLDLEEQEMNYIEKKEYVTAHKISDEINKCSDEIYCLIKPLMQPNESNGDQNINTTLSGNLEKAKKVTTEIIIKCLQVCFYMVVSKKVKSLTPNVCKLYKEFVRRHVESHTIGVRDWALKCSTAYSLLYEPLSKDVYNELYSQFFKNSNTFIWRTSIECIFELLDRYGFENFEVETNDNSKIIKKNGRQLYNTLAILDGEEETPPISKECSHFFYTMLNFLDRSESLILIAVTKGFCRLILHDRIDRIDIVEKLLLRYFNPSTEPELNQILGVFLQSLIEKKKQEYLQLCLLPTISTILAAPFENPFREIKPETVLRFVIDSTHPKFCKIGQNLHNAIATSFLLEMQNNISNKELCKVLAKELLTLETTANDDLELRTTLKSSCDKLLECELDSRTQKNIVSFKAIISGNALATICLTNQDGSDDENLNDNTEDGNSERVNIETTDKQDEININESEQIEMVETTINKTIKETTPLSDIQATLQTPRRSERSPQKTPTTFGRENTTELRYLRKSMNVRESPMSNKNATISSPAKICIETRIDNEGQLAKRTLPTSTTKDTEEFSKSKKSVTPNKSPTSTSSLKNSEEQNLNTSDVIVESPTINERSVIKRRKDRLQSTRNNNQAREPISTRTTRQSSKKARKEQISPTKAVNKRRLGLSISPKIITLDENEKENDKSVKDVELCSPACKHAKLHNPTETSEIVLQNVTSPKTNISPNRNSLKNSKHLENEENITPPQLLSTITIQLENATLRSPIEKIATPQSDTSSVKSLDKRKRKNGPTVEKIIRSTRNSSKKGREETTKVTQRRLSSEFSATLDSTIITKKVNVKISRIPVSVNMDLRYLSSPSSRSTSSRSTSSRSTSSRSTSSRSTSSRSTSSRSTSSTKTASSTNSTSSLKSTIKLKNQPKNNTITNTKTTQFPKLVRNNKGTTRVQSLLRITSDNMESSKSERIILTRSRTPKFNDGHPRPRRIPPSNNITFRKKNV